MDFDTASEHATFGEGDGFFQARLPWPDRSAPEAADPLTVRAALIVVTLVPLGLWAVIWLVSFSLALGLLGEEAAMGAGDFGETSERWSAAERSSAYYRTEAERARRLRADATTTWLKQYLETIIARCERLADEIEQPESP